MTPATLSRDLAGFVHTTLERIASECFADGRLPEVLAGYRLGNDARGDFVHVLHLLHAAGHETLAGRAASELVRDVLRRVDGPATITFASYRIAEAIAYFGGWDDRNPVLAELSDSERSNIAAACDSTSIYDRAGDLLPKHPNNYWTVLLRCELARKELGILPDPALLERAAGHARRWLWGNPLGFFDDSPDGSGRFDGYTFDVHLFCEPIRNILGAERYRLSLARQAELLEVVALANGASIAWGRSSGALSHLATLELAAAALRHGVGNAARHWSLVQHSLTSCRAIFAGGLIDAHQHKSQDAYRGAARRVQMTFDCLAKLLYAAELLRDVAQTPATVPAAELFPPRDTWFAFDAQHAGVWMFRNADWEFQLPCVDIAHSDYAPWLHAPGTIESPVDSSLLCGVPRVWFGHDELSVVARPSAVIKEPAVLRLEYDSLAPVARPRNGGTVPFHRTVQYRVDGPLLEITEQWTFATCPTALSWMFTTTADFTVEVAGTGVRARCVGVSGMAEFRGFWSELRNLFELSLPAAREVQFTVRLLPVGDH